MIHSTLAAVIVLAIASFCQAAESLEALKRQGLSDAYHAALQNRLPAPAKPQGRPVAQAALQEASVYHRGDYIMEADARAAMETATQKILEIGLSVVQRQVVQETPSAYGFLLQYRDNDSDPRSIESFTSGYFSRSAEAQAGLDALKARLRSQGQRMILAQARREHQAPGRYFFRLDSIRGWQKPVSGQTRVFFSDLYAGSAAAHRDMDNVTGALRARGYKVLNATLLQKGVGAYGYEIRYKSL